MADDFLSADLSFPVLQTDQSTDQKLAAMMDYLRLLLEQLRFTLENLGMENFNGTEFSQMSELITHPLNVRLADAEQNMSDLEIEAGAISARVENVKGQVAQVKIQADGISSRVDGVSDTVSENMTRTMSEIRQTADSITQKVTAVDGKYSTTKLLVDGLHVSSSGGESVISGNRIKSGTIEGSTLVCTMAENANESEGKVNLRYGGNDVGVLNLSTDGSGSGSERKNRVFLAAKGDFALKLQSDVNTSYTSNNGMVYIAAPQGEVWLEANQQVRLSLPRGAYFFKEDGIYYNNKKLLSI